MYTVLFSFLFLLVGLTAGWVFGDKYREYMNREMHEFDELFESNPHPEIYDSNGKINKGEYVAINFELGYDPEEFMSDDIVEE